MAEITYENKVIGAKWTAADANEVKNSVNDLYGTNFISTVFVETDGNDSSGAMGKPNKPFLTINAAINALPLTGGVVKIGFGDFNSPTVFKDNISFIGSGKPVPNWVLTNNTIESVVKTTYTAPTKLTGGTVLKGVFSCLLHNNVSIEDLGVDTGSEWCAAFNSGNAANALTIAGNPSALQTASAQNFGVTVRNVSAICKSASSAVHAMLFESLYDFHGENLSTYFGLNGIALKGIGGDIKGVDCHGHQSGGLILKANDYAYGIGINATNVYVTSIGTFDGGGIKLVGESSTLLYTKVTNFTVEDTIYGVYGEGSIDGLILQGGSIYNTQGNGIDLPAGCINFKLTEIEQKLGAIGVLVQGATSGAGNIANVTATSNTGRGFFISPAVAGCVITTANNNAVNNTGAGFHVANSVYGSNNINTGSGADVGAFLSLAYLKSEHLIPDGATITKNIGSTSKAYLAVYSANFLSNDNLFIGTTLAGKNIDIFHGGVQKGRFFNTSGNLLLQNGGTFTDIPSARLIINSTSQGFLPPRMTTTERNAIASPVAGLMIYNTTTNKLNVFTTVWEAITSA